MLLLSFCNFFFLLWMEQKKVVFNEKKKNHNKKSINDTKPKQVKMFDNEDEQRATDSVRVSLADCAPPWAPTHPECCFTPTLHRPTPTVKDQTACLATPHLPPKPSQTLVDVLWQGTNRPDQWIFFVLPPLPRCLTDPSPTQTQTEASGRSPDNSTAHHHYCTPKRLQREITFCWVNLIVLVFFFVLIFF